MSDLSKILTVVQAAGRQKYSNHRVLRRGLVVDELVSTLISWQLDYIARLSPG